MVYQFQLVSDDYYSNNWPQALPEIADCILEEVDENNPLAYLSTWFGQNYMTYVYMQGYSHDQAVEALNERRDAYCAICGAWGFVYGYGSMATYTAPTADDDLDCYLERILSDDGAAWFQRYYSNYPLVMKKYELLRDVIENEMGVKLN